MNPASEIPEAETHMRRALKLAALGRHASPNPMVGCVLVSADGVRLGEGWHHRRGDAHAEIMALQAAGTRPTANVTAYVTLEPCAHHGRTPPCTEALIAAGIGRVVIAMSDPDARVAGAGIQQLRTAGIQVDTGLLEQPSGSLNAAYVKHRITGLPWVVLKSVMTLDGKIATVSGDSRWISADVSRVAVHRQLRDRCDAILCGVGTVMADDPALTTRLHGGRNPWRIILDSRGRTPPDAAVIRQSNLDGRTILATTRAMPLDRQAFFQQQGCTILMCDTTSDGRVSLVDLLRQLGRSGNMISVLAEGGGELSASLLSDGLVDRLIMYIAPKIVGGIRAPGPFGGGGIDRMVDAVGFSSWRIKRSGPDIRIDARFGSAADTACSAD